MFGGFLLSAVLEAYSLWKDRDQLRNPDQPPPEDSFLSLAKGLKRMNAFNVYELMHNLILMALQITLDGLQFYCHFSPRDSPLQS
jgi:hypothetical protein